MIFLVVAVLLLVILLITSSKNTIDNYTSAQPNPPHNVVYPYNTHYRYPILGIDCTGDCGGRIYPKC
jgi:hypothetical protein